MKQRKFKLILPLLILPFILMLFVVLGGGRGSAQSFEKRKSEGLNPKLPDAHFSKGKEKSKLLLYEEAGRDSAAFAAKLRNDPYFQSEKNKTGLNDLFPAFRNGTDENESKIMENLAKLKSVLHEKTDISEPLTLKTQNGNGRLEKLFSNLGHTESPDPKIEELNGMLDKVMSIQHPEILQDSLARIAMEHKLPVYSVKISDPPGEPSSFGAADNDILIRNPNRFYDLSDDQPLEKISENSIEAIVPETQSLVSGSTVKLRLQRDISIHGQIIPKFQDIYGIASLNNERLKIKCSSVRAGNDILPVSLEAYDLDGIEGLFIPGSMNRDVAKQSGDQAINSLGLASLDPSIGAQAAGAGIQAAKTLLSHKIKLVKVTVRAGYKVFLKDSK